MERAGRLIGKMNRASRVMSDEDLVRAAWPLAVGKTITRYTAVAGLVRKSVVIEVQDMIWQRQLNTLGRQIVKKLTDIVGPGIVEDLELRPMTPKRMPQRAESSRRQMTFDEADSIADPSLRLAYKTSRKKASA